MRAPSPTPPPLSQWWLLLAVSSLGLAALAAIVLVLARSPVLTALVATDTFPRALVIHVNLATLVWYVSMAGALWTEGLPAHRQRLALLPLLAAAVGVAGICIAGLVGSGHPVLANYIPYVQANTFLAAQAGFFTAGLATAALSLRRPRDPAEWGFAIGRWPFFMACIYLVAALRQGYSLDDAVWGAGHILQFGFVTLMMAIWLRLVERTGISALSTRTAITLFAAASIPASVGPCLILVGAVEHEALRSLHTAIMRWSNWPAPLAFGLMLAGTGRAAMRAHGFIASLVLFVTGILAGAAIDAQTTMIPAHYHGTIGAFTLALMAAVLARVAPPRTVSGRRPADCRLLHLYAGGMAVLICGLAWSGVLGAPRKTAFMAANAGLDTILAAALTGTGGAVTIAAIGLFVFVALPRIIRLCKAPSARQQTGKPATTASTFAAAPQQ